MKVSQTPSVGLSSPDDASEDEPYSYVKEITCKALNRQLKDQTDGAKFFPQSKNEPKLVKGVCQDGRNRRAHLLQTGWRQGKIGSVGWQKPSNKTQAAGDKIEGAFIRANELGSSPESKPQLWFWLVLVTI